MLHPYHRCIVFLADGARPDVLQEELTKGNLPTLARHFVEQGTFQTILTTFPSTTGPAYLPYLTGCFPGTCNLPGIRWFDKINYAKKGWSLKSFRSYVGLETYLMPRDLKKGIKTAFELFERPASIFNMVNRGIHRGHNKTRHSRIWYLYYAHLTDHWSFVDFVAGQKLLQCLDEDPDFVFVVLPGIDEYSHRSSPFHPTARKAYQDLDTIVNQTVATLKAKGWLDSTLLIIVSDHGLSETKVHFDVGPFLEKKGIPTFFYTQIFKFRFQAASMVSGNAMAHLYFKNEKGWGERTYFEELVYKSLLLDELRLRPEIGLVACQGADGSIHVLTEKGHGFFKWQEKQIAYQWERDEPLGILRSSDEKKKIFSQEESLALTFDSHTPDVFTQLTQLFSSPRSGDIVLSANPGFDLRERYEHPEHKASHGSLCPEHMKVPFLMNCRLPDLRPHIRSVDVFPTILKLMNRQIPPSLDGIIF